MSPTDAVMNVSAYLGIDPESIMQRDRHAPIAWARHICMWLVREEWGFSFPYIARLFGMKNHTSVIHAVRRVSCAADLNLAFAEWLTWQMQKLEAP